MDGVWTFWDSQGVKVAEISYQKGFRSGAFRLYYGSLYSNRYDPIAAGWLKAVGYLRDDKIVGEHVAYLSDGTVDSRAIVTSSGSVEASLGSPELVRRLLEADERLFRKLEAAVLDSTR